jgi:hypothetical protein
MYWRNGRRGVVVGLLASVLLLVLGSTAQAQSAAQSSGSTPPASWAVVGGFDWDTQETNYGFFGPMYVDPIRPNLAWTARVFGSYLRYEFQTAAGLAKVRAPGVSGAVGLQFGSRNTFSVSVGPAISWRRTTTTTPAGAEVKVNDTRAGATFGVETYLNPTSQNNLHGLLYYSTADEYLWSRLGFKQKVAGSGATSFFVGPEVVVQGNEDIRSQQVGAVFSLARGNGSVDFRAGYKRSTFDLGPNKTGPYFGVGFYVRLP